MTGLLREYLRQKSAAGIVLAFSGGAGSLLLLALLEMIYLEAPFPVAAVSIQSIFCCKDELDHLRASFAHSKIPLKLFYYDPLAVPGNLKQCIFSEIASYAAANKLQTVLSGSTTARTPNISTPLAELKISLT